MIGRAIAKPLSIAALAAVYTAALTVGFVVAEVALGIGVWQAALLGDLAATGVVFLASAAANNTSVYDPYWSVLPLPIALWMQANGNGDPVRFIVVAVLLGVWGIRLTLNFLTGWRGLAHEDWRYTEYRRFGTARYWLVSLGGLQMIPTLVVFAAMLPVYAVTREPGSGIRVLDVVAAVVVIAAIALETVADLQKRRFSATAAPGAFITSGVWSRCRHPNYLGEIGLWWGLLVFAVAAGWGNTWTVVGPLVMTALFVFISVPLMDRRMRARRPGYAEHIARVPALVPRLVRRER
jgi:steroid 5-alpha reductase family enzyme